MSYATFAHSFRKTTGNNFVEFVNRVRIGQACSKLYMRSAVQKSATEAAE